MNLGKDHTSLKVGGKDMCVFGKHLLNNILVLDLLSVYVWMTDQEVRVVRGGSGRCFSHSFFSKLRRDTKCESPKEPTKVIFILLRSQKGTSHHM